MSKEKNAKEKQGEAKPRHVLVGTYKKGQLILGASNAFLSLAKLSEAW